MRRTKAVSRAISMRKSGGLQSNEWQLPDTFIMTAKFRRIPLIRAAIFFLALHCFVVAEDGIFVAVGGGGRVMTSRDGQTWENAQEWDA